jgi:CRP-like cAMP-binding protein
VATVDTLALEIDSDVVYDLCEEHFYFLHALIRRLAHAILDERKQIPHGEFLGRREPLIECPERRLDFVERVVLMRRGGVFVNSGLDALASLARKMEEVRRPAGSAIWARGDHSGHVLMLISGVVECRQAEGRGTFYCGAGYPLGNLESLAGERRWYDATCETDLVALRGSTEDFLDMLEDDFQMASDFLHAFSAGLIRARSASPSGLPMSGRGVVRPTWHAR